MKIYSNFDYEILALDNPPKQFAHEIEVDQTREEMFGNLCDVCVCAYKYEPVYEMLFNDDGSYKLNEKTGDILYKTDGSGNRVQIGWQLYSFMDYQTIQMMQRQYLATQCQLDELTCIMADIIGGVYNA